MSSGKLCILGDSIFKGITLEKNTNKYIVGNGLDFALIADRAGLKVENHSKFGCTVTKAWEFVKRKFSSSTATEAPEFIFMDFGGNDCDFKWNEINDKPLDVHNPNTDISTFIGTYESMLDGLVEKGSKPVITTLIPVQSEKYFNWLCKNMNLAKEKVMSWLGDIDRIAHFQQVYSDAIKGIAAGRDIPLVDLRAAFDAEKDQDLMCEDGIHPNERGQKLIYDCFDRFMCNCLTF